MTEIEKAFKILDNIFHTDGYIEETEDCKGFNVYCNDDINQLYRAVMSELFANNIDFKKITCRPLEDVEEKDWFIVVEQFEV